MLRSMTLSGLLGLALLTACTTPTADLCAKQDQCRIDENVDGDNDDSDDGDDDVAVCTAFSQNLIDALRANAEPECSEYANALDEVSRCKVALDCDDLIESDFSDCEDQQETADDICDKIADDKINCEVGIFGTSSSLCANSSPAEGEGEGEGDGCDFENDGICDDSSGTGDCPDGTDLDDCG